MHSSSPGRISARTPRPSIEWPQPRCCQSSSEKTCARLGEGVFDIADSRRLNELSTLLASARCGPRASSASIAARASADDRERRQIDLHQGRRRLRPGSAIWRRPGRSARRHRRLPCWRARRACCCSAPLVGLAPSGMRPEVSIGRRSAEASARHGRLMPARGLRDIDPVDAGMGDRAADEGAMQDVRQP